MRIIIRINVIFLFIFSSSNIFSQENLIRPLKIGDKVPDIVLEHMVNYPGGRAKFSDFKGKLLILDFWNMGCGPCINAFPKLQKIQKQFGDKIQILLVNVMNTPEGMKKYGFPKNTKSPIIPKIELPFALYSKQMDTLFPHGPESYHVWIDQNGFVKWFTDHTGTSVGRITDFLAGKPLTLPSIRDIRIDQTIGLNTNASLLKLVNNTIKADFVYSSVITKNLYITGATQGGLYDTILKRTNGIRIIGNLLDMCRQLYPQFRDTCFDRVVLNVKSPEKFVCPLMSDEKFSEWNTENVFCYELMVPAGNLTSSYDSNMNILRNIMKQDLERLYLSKISWEKRKVMCRVLIRTINEDKLQSKGERILNEKANYDGGLILRNQPITTLLDELRYVNSRVIPILPILNEAGFDKDKKIDIVIESSLGNIAAVRKELKKYGLDIIEAEREIEVLVIDESKNPFYN